jgi:MFS family permease
MPFISTAVMFYITAIAAAKGWPAGLIAASFPASAIAHVVGLFASGTVIDRVSARGMFPFQSVPIVIAAALLGVVQAPWALPVAFALIGLGGGFMKPVITAVWAELFGLSVLGAIRSAIAMYMVVMSALSPFVFGSLIGAGYAVDPILIAFAIGGAICLLPSFFAAWRRWN